jgi:hypothetical protein
MRNGRCRTHGGPSTGLRTSEGLERSRKASWRHGYYSAEAKAERQRSRATLATLRELKRPFRFAAFLAVLVLDAGS